ncbi:hypothetical protein Glove_236g26 [Diversispora epigaea]|uniref:Uncharacterized protein n=1 Tax=Diversispora epigaea TaxID=1348612 RepID=A0A397ID94_9GLOM|nr:hypothetical protein Glove_236g26 [Diversispora epigaea]
MTSNQESTLFDCIWPTSFGKNQIGDRNYTVKIVCPIPDRWKVDFAFNNNNKNNKKVKFSNFIKILDVDSVEEYDRCGQLGQKEENFKIDVWFTGETLKKTKYNMGKSKCGIKKCQPESREIKKQLESVDEVYELLSQEGSCLQELYVKCAKIYQWMLERRALIEKMIEFEKRPTPFFQSSFRLLEEENEENLVGPI